MDIYTVESIIEADYGCEDTGRMEPMALVKLSSEDGERNVEVSEAEISRQGLREGKIVILNPEGKLLKYVRVVAAVIKDNSQKEKRIFATARGYGEYKGWWEFPGGKIESGETPQEALVREIKEELTAEIKVYDLIQTIEYDYPEFHLSMDCFWADVVEGKLILKEAQAARWLTYNELKSVKWLPADEMLVEKIKNEWIR